MAQTFASVGASTTLSTGRTAWNNADEALRTLHSGTSAPSSTVAGLLWFDTTNDLVKMRNEADSGWIVIWDSANGVVRTAVASYQFTLAASSYSTEAEVPIIIVPYNATLLTARLVSSQTTASSDGSNKWLSSILNKTEGVDISSADLNTDTTELTSFAAQSYALTGANTDLAAGDVLTGTIQSVGSPTSLQHYSWTFQITYSMR